MKQERVVLLFAPRRSWQMPGCDRPQREAANKESDQIQVVTGEDSKIESAEQVLVR